MIDVMLMRDRLKFELLNPDAKTFRLINRILGKVNSRRWQGIPRRRALLSGWSFDQDKYYIEVDLFEGRGGRCTSIGEGGKVRKTPCSELYGESDFGRINATLVSYEVGAKLYYCNFEQV